MTTTTLDPRRGSDRGITAAEIWATERLLQFIDLNNDLLTAGAQWLLIWKATRELWLQFHGGTAEMQSETKVFFLRLIDGLWDCGNRLSKVLADRDITSEHCLLATGCNRESFGVCMSILDDFRVHLREPIDAEELNTIWEGFSGESSGVVQASA